MQIANEDFEIKVKTPHMNFDWEGWKKLMECIALRVKFTDIGSYSVFTPYEFRKYSPIRVVVASVYDVKVKDFISSPEGTVLYFDEKIDDKVSYNEFYIVTTTNPIHFEEALYREFKRLGGGMYEECIMKKIIKTGKGLIEQMKESTVCTIPEDFSLKVKFTDIGEYSAFTPYVFKAFMPLKVIINVLAALIVKEWISTESGTLMYFDENISGIILPDMFYPCTTHKDWLLGFEKDLTDLLKNKPL